MNKIDFAKSPYKGSAQITREQFLFYEMRTTARLVNDGLEKDSVIEKIVKDNLFQFPTEKSVQSIAKACIKRLDALNDSGLVAAIAEQPSDIARQICLYAMMRQYRLIWDFMILIIGEKYQKLDTSFGKMDLNTFFIRLQEQDDYVASWSDSTVTRLKMVIKKLLIDNEYLDDRNAKDLNPVLICPLLENAIRDAGQEIALPAFNCLN